MPQFTSENAGEAVTHHYCSCHCTDKTNSEDCCKSASQATAPSNSNYYLVAKKLEEMNLSKISVSNLISQPPPLFCEENNQKFPANRKHLYKERRRKLTGTEEFSSETENSMTHVITSTILRALQPENKYKVVSSINKIHLKGTDLARLCGKGRLNDLIIDFYLTLVAEKSRRNENPVYAFSTFFYTCLKFRGNAEHWARKLDVFSYNLLLIPIHFENRWALCAVDNCLKKIKYYSSAAIYDTRCFKLIKCFLASQEKKKKHSYDVLKYTEEIVESCPKQKNRCDGGVYTLLFAECISRNAPLKFTSNQIPAFRQRIMYELLDRSIIDPER